MICGDCVHSERITKYTDRTYYRCNITNGKSIITDGKMLIKFHQTACDKFIKRDNKINCVQCGKVFIPKNYRCVKCQECRKSNFNRAQKNITRKKTYIKMLGAEHKGRLLTKSQQVKYCESHRNNNDENCLTCELSDCVQVSKYRGNIEQSKDFEERYLKIKEKTWLSVDEFEVVEVWGDMITERTTLTGNGRNKYVRNNIGRR